ESIMPGFSYPFLPYRHSFISSLPCWDGRGLSHAHSWASFTAPAGRPSHRAISVRGRPRRHGQPILLAIITVGFHAISFFPATTRGARHDRSSPTRGTSATGRRPHLPQNTAGPPRVDGTAALVAPDRNRPNSFPLAPRSGLTCSRLAA